jgi:predicted branched-subunit amino acid permease
MLIVAASLIGVGGMARDAGFSMDVAVGSTLLIWAGPAQLLFFSAVAAKTSWPAIALTISLSSVRFLPMCVALLPMLRTKRTGVATLIVAVHCIAVTVWAESMRRLPAIPRAARLPFFFGFSTMCFIGTTISTAVGHALIGELSKPFAAGLLFLTPIYFVSTLLRAARQPIDWMALVFGLAFAPVTQALAPEGFDFLFLGVIAGSAAFLGQKIIDARRDGA